MSVRKVLLTFIVAALAAFAAIAQQQAMQPQQQQPELLAPTVQPAVDEEEVPEGGMPVYIKEETPEERRERLGTPEDPGMNPSPDRVFVRFGKKYKIRRYEREFARYDPASPKTVRPMAMVNFTFEIYQQNDKYVWVWMEELPPRRSREERKKAAEIKPVPKETIDYLNQIRDEFTPLDPPASPVKIRFEESSQGLPGSGSWRNSGAAADMNGDGKLDLVLPPQRAGNGIPAIFLGDGKGGWTQWQTNFSTRLNYGSVVAADFNKDKHMDVAFSVHLTGVAVFLGDGKGEFKEVFYDKAFPSRRIVTADIDRDGWMDVVAITEGPTGRSADPKAKEYTAVRGYLNRAKGTKWEGFNIAHPKDNASGDWLAVGNFNNDRFPDFVTSTIYFNGTSTVHLSQGEPKKYDFFWDGKGAVIPFRSYYSAVSTGRFTNKDRDDAIVAHYRIWPPKVDPEQIADPPLERVVGLDRISFAADGKAATRTPIMRWEPGRSLPGIASADFNRDGKLDVMFTRHDPREAVLLVGDGKGGFARASIEGITLRPQSNYDLLVADVNADSLPDVVVMYESESATSLSARNGSVHVYLNRGAAAQ
ncbi:MAG TPA: VCBS repeat-containing protein [Thermoanaerobaculia bacterium]